MSHKIGFWSVFALVTGSQIGSGVFMLPASLAPYGIVSVAGWSIAGVGAMVLALVFAKLCSWLPKTGGPHVYVDKAFGKSAAFFTGWTYWVVSWVSSTAVIITSIGYLLPLLGNPSPLVHLILEIGLLIGITAINFKGVKAAGEAEFILTVLKVVPLIFMPIAALFFFDQKNITIDASVASLPLSTMLSHVVLFTLWGFIGLETATTPAESVENPTKTISKAVVFGTFCVVILYVMNSVAIMGVIPSANLMNSKAPYVDAASIIFGGNWYIAISIIAAIVCIGSLNAWILASGQIALGLAQDRLLPAFFARKNRHDAPWGSLFISCTGILPLLFLTADENIAQRINTIIDFSVVSFVFVYTICCIAFLKLQWQKKQTKAYGQWIYGVAALSFCVWIIASTPLKTILVASLFTISGIPVLFWQYCTTIRQNDFRKKLTVK